MIVLDTSGLLAALAANDRHHGEAKRALEGDRGPHVIPAGMVAEAAYMIETRLGARVLDAFLDDLLEGAFTLDCGEDDLARIRTLVSKYADLPLGFADAAVTAAAERWGAPILTFDRRDFTVVARDTRIGLVP